jgi:pimeloyl-ACP methyl ester carboxylesterase
MVIAQLKKCMEGYDADLRLYTTTIAMDDLDEVRAFLGYDKINVYGGSYGTRAGLVYMRQHGDRVRTAVLDGVAPTNMRLPLFFPRDAQRAFDKLIADCEADAGCHNAYPNLGARARALIARLEKTPAVVTVVHPRTGERGEIRMTARVLTNVIAATLYQPLVASLLPALIERAEKDDFQGVLALTGMNDTGEPNMSLGMQLSVICAEDFPRLTPEELRKEAEGSVFGGHVMWIQREGCNMWPRGAVDASFYEPVTSDIPTLVMSGEIDPVTPPVWGEEIAKTLSNAKHIVMPGTGHTAGGTGCGRRMIKAFVDAGTLATLDTSCVQKVTRPPYFVTPAGPDPSSAKASAGQVPANQSPR